MLLSPTVKFLLQEKKKDQKNTTHQHHVHNSHKPLYWRRFNEHRDRPQSCHLESLYRVAGYVQNTMFSLSWEKWRSCKGCCRNCSVSSAWKAPFVIFKLFFISKSYKSSKSCVNKAPCNSLAKKVQNTTEAARMSHLTTRVNPLIVDEVKLWLK